VWAIDDIAEALEHASPVLAQKVRALCATQDPAARETRRAVLSVGRYLQRMAGRPTPFGLLAGVAPASFAASPEQSSGNQHQAVAQAGAQWLAQVIAKLEDCPGLLARLAVVANSTLMVRGSRLIVPYQPQPHDRGTAAVEVSLRHTAAVRTATDLAHTPIRLEDLGAKIQADFPTATPEKITAMLTELVHRHALITSLHAPSTEPDALGHLVRQLEAVHASTIDPIAGLVVELTEIHTMLERHNPTPATAGRTVRAKVAERMRRLARTSQHPVALDLRLDATWVFPEGVAREIEQAAMVLTRLSAYPVGTPAWRAYHQRFYERFGIGSMVPVLDVVADSGIGWPDGYPGTVTTERRSAISARDEGLLALAQSAALDGRDEVVLDEHLIDTLQLGSQPLRPPSHMELAVRVWAADRTALARGDFRLEVVTVSRAAGVMTGRFLAILDPDSRVQLTACLANLPTADPDTVAAQLSFPPLDPATAHVTRAIQTLPTLISLAEHRGPGDHALTLADLAVGCDGRRMYLAVPARGQRLEPAGSHALNLVTHTPPLARFLTELGRAQCAQVTEFDWGAAAHLPFLPRLSYGRIILSPARWRLTAAELPAPAGPSVAWDDALTAWRQRRRVARLVHLTEGDQRLPLDLDHPGHQAILRAHLSKAPQAVLTEAPAPQDLGWCDGRTHEVIVPVTATRPPPWPHMPRPATARILRRHAGQPPAASSVLLASLYGDVHRQDLVLTEYLPTLLTRLDQPPWWYVRYRDPDPHLRLRIALPEPAAFGEAAATVSTWAGELHQLGLLRDVRYPTSYAETGRWGAGPAWTAAEEVFRTDSHALLVQLGLPTHPHRRALVAAHSVAIAIAFTGSTPAGMQWLLDHIPATAPDRVPRPVFTEAVRVADPRGDWATLRSAPGGAAIVEAWLPRDDAVAAYRAHLPGPHTHGIAADDVLSSLMHVNFVRACGIDFDEEAVGLYLARAAALAWTARTTGGS
jgi:thiopeptide-type bacteriocin biosynthesis protein